MHVHESLRQPEGGDLVLGVATRDELDLAFIERGIDTDAPQRIEVDLDVVAIADQRIEVREALAPPAPAIDHHRRDAVASAQQA